MSKGAKEDESSTGRLWAAGFHHVTARSRVVRVLKLMYSGYGGATVHSIHEQQQ
jgi:hypothetical protein